MSIEMAYVRLVAVSSYIVESFGICSRLVLQKETCHSLELKRCPYNVVHVVMSGLSIENKIPDCNESQENRYADRLLDGRHGCVDDELTELLQIFSTCLGILNDTLY